MPVHHKIFDIKGQTHFLPLLNPTPLNLHYTDEDKLREEVTWPKSHTKLLASSGQNSYLWCQFLFWPLVIGMANLAALIINFISVLSMWSWKGHFISQNIHFLFCVIRPIIILTIWTNHNIVDTQKTLFISIISFSFSKRHRMLKFN